MKRLSLLLAFAGLMATTSDTNSMTIMSSEVRARDANNLMWQSITDNNPEQLQIALDNGANRLEPKDFTRRLPIHVASLISLELVRRLLSRDKDKQINAMVWQSPLFFAIEANKPDIVAYLLEQGANRLLPNHFGLLPIHTAQSLPVLQLLLSKDPEQQVNAESSGGATPLSLAILRGSSPDIWEYLLDKGANPYLKNQKGKDLFALTDQAIKYIKEDDIKRSEERLKAGHSEHVIMISKYQDDIKNIQERIKLLRSILKKRAAKQVAEMAKMKEFASWPPGLLSVVGSHIYSAPETALEGKEEKSEGESEAPAAAATSSTL